MRWDLPESWEWAQAREVATIVAGGTPTAGDPTNFAEPGIPWLTPADLSKFGGTYSERGARSLSPKGLAESSARRLPKGTVLFTSRAPIGYCTIAANEITTNQGFKNLILKPGLVPEFVRHYLLASKDYAESLASGTTFLELSGSRMAEVELPVAPINEQKRIVARLDALQARSRAAREALAEVPALLDTFRQSVLAAAFRGDLTAGWRAKNPDAEPASKLLGRVRRAHGEWWASTGRKKKWEPAKPLYAGGEGLPELPPGWAWASSAEIVRPGTIITYGIVLPGAHVPGGVPYVRGGDIENGRILTDQLLCTAPEIAATKPDSELEPDDVLLCIIRHLKVAVVPPELQGANLTQGTVRLRCSEATSNEFLANYLASPFAQEWMKAKHFGLAMPRINVEHAREVPVPIPPKAEQVAISEVLATAMERLRGLENSARQHAADLDTLDQSILARAFRGELVDQDPNDEPAATLLARLKRSESRR